MNETGEAPEARTPAERRLEEHLALLRMDPPQPSVALVPRIVHTARWQRAVRRPLLAMGALVGALFDGLRLVFGQGPRHDR